MIFFIGGAAESYDKLVCHNFLLHHLFQISSIKALRY